MNLQNMREHRERSKTREIDLAITKSFSRQQEMVGSVVMLGANRLIPLAGKTTVAHGTRNKILGLLDTAVREHGRKRTMIADVSALVWNYDTCAIVGGTPGKVTVRVQDRAELLAHVQLDDGLVDDLEKVAGPCGPGSGVLMPESSVGWPPTWVPNGMNVCLYVCM